MISRNRALLLACFALLFKITSAAQEVGYNIHPDARFKADLLVIVAHPDDESEIGSYLARAVFDQHKRVAVIFGTRGNTGGNAQGGEQSMSLGLIREIEGRRAVAYFGITNVWFLGAPDTAGQSVLHSLETWNHGRCLEEVTRIVRLTQPDVIATWLPDYSAGENHGDHQASGVLATEAFDIAGDPTQFPEQIAPPRFPTGISNMTEGLLPWQPQKLYYFSDAANTDFMNGQGPSYNAGDISPSKKESYARLAAEEVSFHLTQSDSGAAARRALDRDQVEKTYLAQPARMILGKSHVPCSRTGDVFEGVTRAISFQRVTPHPFPEKSLRLQLGGAWHFYPDFWAAHGLDHLASLIAPEVLAGENQKVTVSVLLDNPGNDDIRGKLDVKLPPDWKLDWGAGAFHVDAGSTWSSSVVLIAPGHSSNEWKNVVITATAPGHDLGQVSVRLQVAQYALPQ